MMKFFVMNRDEIEEEGIDIGQQYVLISISCPDDKPKLKKDDLCLEILRLEFDDLDRWIKPFPGHKEYRLFNKEDARKILDFFVKHRISCPNLVVHCDAGISRSPAVAAALTNICGQTDKDYFVRYHPNRLVYSTILSEHHHPQRNK